MTPVASAPPAAAKDTPVRPFRVKVPEAALVDLRRRTAATRWPERETVNNRSQGLQLDLLQDVFGRDKSPCRLMYGVASLPLGTPVELEVIFEVEA
jgi:hypothetical protein